MAEDANTVDAMREQAESVQQWLKFAPAPPERGHNSYDAFISYRSSDRAWAMALYDILKLAGWEPFLDQYELVPGSDLESSLSDALEASSSGVILWSSHTADSEWCKRERNAMRTIKDERGTFNYVFAKLDGEPLPLFARSDLYIDFADTPEGPRGVNLLKLLCGMRGVSLSHEAVEMAQRVDQDAARSLVAVRGAIDAENRNRLVQIGTSAEPGVLASPTPVLTAAEGLISMGEDESARTVLQHALVHFPKSIRARQLEGLALRRQKKYQDAIDVLSELKAAGHQDPETLGILAAAWDGLYQESGKTLHLRKSRELYRTAFQGDRTSYYAGINAASKSLFLGEADEAIRLATEVFPLVEHARDGEDFWAGLTLAEVYLLRREIQAALAQYQRMIDKYSARRGDLRGAEQQALRICEALHLEANDANAVLAPFRLLDL